MSIMETMDIGVRSLSVHGKRIDLHAKNIANHGNAQLCIGIMVLYILLDLCRKELTLAGFFQIGFDLIQELRQPLKVAIQIFGVAQIVDTALVFAVSKIEPQQDAL